MVAEVHDVRPPGAPNTGSWLFRPMPRMPEQWRSPEAQDQLLHEWLITPQSIPAFAKARGLTVDQLFDWLHSEEITDRRKRLEYMAQLRAESLARLNLPDAIGTLAATMRDENAYPKERRMAASAIVRAVAKADKEPDLSARAKGLTVPRQTLAAEVDAPSDQTLGTAAHPSRAPIQDHARGNEPDQSPPARARSPVSQSSRPVRRIAASPVPPSRRSSPRAP